MSQVRLFFASRHVQQHPAFCGPRAFAISFATATCVASVVAISVLKHHQRMVPQSYRFCTTDPQNPPIRFP